MWLISFLPDTIVHLLLAAGAIGVIAGFLLGFIPFISTYKLPIQVISILVLVFSVYLEGGIAEQANYKLLVAEMEKKVAEAEAKAALTNVEVVEHVVTKTEVIHEKGDQIIKYINKEVVKYDNSCEIPDIVVKIHNAAALNQPIEDKP